MSSSDRSVRTARIQARRPAPRGCPPPRTNPTPNSARAVPFRLLSLLLTFAACASGCTHGRVRAFSAQQAADAISAQAAAIKTERGRAWISARTPHQKISFPAVIAIDRTDPGRPLLRIEAMDPLGATHALLVLDGHRQLTWVDYDQRKIYRVRESWYGIPLARLPELLLGFMSVPSGKRTGGDGSDSFEVVEGANTFRYEMRWIDPGPRLAVGSIEGSIYPDGRAGPRANVGARERYLVDYSHFLDKDDFYLPQDVKLRGFGRGEAGDELDEKPLVELNVAWRERRWNEPVPMKVFALPNGPLEEFSRE